MEPNSPIELSELTAALSAIARQFEIFAVEEGLAARAKDAKLLVSSVKPGSIDIGLLPDLVGTMGPLLAPLVPLAKVVGFATKLKGLIDAFRTKPLTSSVTVKDCEDVGAIVGTIANHGGSQTLNVHNGDVYNQVLVVNGADALEIAANAARAKAELQYPDSDGRQRVAMVWSGLDKVKARQRGLRSPDKAVIEEIDPKARPVFFEDAFAYLKQEMLEGEDNPYRLIYFVDVEISRVEGRVASYRVTGFHGTTERDGGEEP